MTHDFGKDERKGASEASGGAPLMDTTPEMQEHKVKLILVYCYSFNDQVLDH